MDLHIFVVAVILALHPSWALNLDDSRSAKILKYDFKNDGSGLYYFQYLTSDGQSREENGNLEHAETNHAELVVKGSYSFTAADGVVYTVRYTADKDGFHPEGDHIKVPPYTPWPTNLQIDDSDQTSSNERRQEILVSTPPPPVTNTYIPSPTPPKIYDPNPFPSQNQDISRAYIPSTPGPFSKPFNVVQRSTRLVKETAKN